MIEPAKVNYVTQPVVEDTTAAEENDTTAGPTPGTGASSKPNWQQKVTTLTERPRSPFDAPARHPRPRRLSATAPSVAIRWGRAEADGEPASPLVHRRVVFRAARTRGRQARLRAGLPARAIQEHGGQPSPVTPFRWRPTRGSILDRNGRDLALSIDRTTIYADPSLVVDPLGAAQVLSRRSSASPYP